MHLDIHDALTKKIGPLPGGVWAGIAVVGIVAYVHFHKGSTSSSTASQTDPGVGALQAPGGLLGSGGGGGGGGGDTGAVAGAGSFDAGAGGGFDLGSSGGVASSSTDPTPTFVPILDPSATVFPDATPTEPRTQTLNVSTGGNLIGTVQAPILPISAPASELYASVGLKASDPITLTPQTSPQDATSVMQASRAAETIPTAGHPVAV